VDYNCNPLAGTKIATDIIYYARKCYLDVVTKQSFSCRKNFFPCNKKFFLNRKNIVPRKKKTCRKKRIVLSLHQENIFLAPENISVS